MNRLLIRRLDPAEPDALSLFETMDGLFDSIRKRAFSLFQERGGGVGGDLQDWLQAEREFLWVPPAELIEEENQFRIRLVIPGLEPNEVEVTALPESIVVHAKASSKEQKDTKAVRLREFAEKELCRRFEFQEPINPDLVQASLEKGILEITAVKTAPAKQIKVAVQGA